MCAKFLGRKCREFVEAKWKMDSVVFVQVVSATYQGRHHGSIYDVVTF